MWTQEELWSWGETDGGEGWTRSHSVQDRHSRCHPQPCVVMELHHSKIRNGAAVKYKPQVMLFRKHDMMHRNSLILCINLGISN